MLQLDDTYPAGLRLGTCANPATSLRACKWFRKPYISAAEHESAGIGQRVLGSHLVLTFAAPTHLHHP